MVPTHTRTWDDMQPALLDLWEGIDSSATLSGGNIPYFDSTTAPLHVFRKLLDAQIALQQRARNDLLPIHRLPRLVFIYILQLAHNFFDYYGWDLELWQLHRYAQVSTYWRDIILSTSWFWRVVKSQETTAEQELYLRRNTSGGVVLWSCGSRGRHRDEYLRRMQCVSERWEMVYIDGDFSRTVFDCLSHLPPRVKDLTARLESATNTATKTRLLPLPDGAALYHVSLNHVALPWDSTRLRALRSLELWGLDSHFPSLQQLLAILSSSRHLSKLDLYEWAVDESLPNFEEDSKQLVDTRIVLPALDILSITRIHPLLASFLLTHISTPNVRCVLALGFHPNAFSDPSSLFELLRSSLRLLQYLNIEYTSDKEYEVVIRSCPELSYTALLAYTSVESPGLYLRCSFNDATTGDWDNMFAFLAQANVSATLALYGEYLDPPPEDEPTTTPPIIPPLLPPESLKHLSTLDRININCNFNASAVLRYLGASRACPSLKRITIFCLYAEVDVMVEDVVAFMKGRDGRSKGSAEDSGPKPLESLDFPEQMSEQLLARPEIAPVLGLLRWST
ncbi:hypothetical protein FRB99_002010 [Tulasnella sp. 403]|nr:hypothetical protein FRB99_002010 [Tulasnella sp. 403]